MSKLNELIKDLSKPFPYDWRVQSFNKDKTKAICTSYVDARTVQTILDEKCAEHGYTWEADYKEVCGVIFCGITLTSLNTLENKLLESVTRWDAGNRIENDEGDKMYVQGGKSAASDAFKRAAVMFGLGRFLYDIAPMTLPADGYNVIDDKKQKVYDLTTYIRGLNTKPRSKRKALAPPTPPAQPKADDKPAKHKLNASAFENMKRAIESGNYQAVEEAMPKYEISLAQNTVLTAAIAAAKAKAAEKTTDEKSN